jgi:hypothetical protein
VLGKTLRFGIGYHHRSDTPQILVLDIKCFQKEKSVTHGTRISNEDKSGCLFNWLTSLLFNVGKTSANSEKKDKREGRDVNIFNIFSCFKLIII